jgi:hypothetical protein
MPQGIPVSHCPGSNSHILVMSPEPSRIAGACAAYTEITSIEVGLHKSPVRDGSGALGVRLKLNAKELADLR